MTITKLAPEHEAQNKAFPWPKAWPKSLDEAIRFLAAHVPHPDVYQLGGPVPAPTLAKIEKDLGRPLPLDLRSFLMRHDGLAFTWSGGHWTVAPLAAMGDLTSMFREELQRTIDEIKAAEGADGDWRETLFEGLSEKDLALDQIFPFGVDVTGDVYCLYLAAQGETGEMPVLRFSHEGRFHVQNSSFARFLFFQTCYGHTHPQVPDPRLDKFQENRPRVRYRAA